MRPQGPNQGDRGASKMPDGDRASGFFRFGAFFLLGISFSFWLLPVLFGPQVQRLRIERDAAMAEVQSLRAEALLLKEADQSRQKAQSVRTIKVRLEGEVGERVVLEAAKRLRQQLTAQYVSRSLEFLDEVLLYSRLQGSLLEIDGIRYRLDVKLIALRSDLTVYGLLSVEKSSEN